MDQMASLGDMEEFYSARGTETQLLREDFNKNDLAGEIDTMRSEIEI